MIRLVVGTSGLVVVLIVICWRSLVGLRTQTMLEDVEGVAEEDWKKVSFSRYINIYLCSVVVGVDLSWFVS